MAQHGRRKQKEKSARKPLWLAIVFIVAWLAIGGTTGPLFGKLTSVQENDSSGFLPSSAESTKAGELAAKFVDQDADLLPALVIFTGDVNEAAIADLTAFVQTFPSAEVPESGGRTLNDFIAKDAQLFPIPAEDGKAAIVSVPFDDAVLASPLENNEPALQVPKTHSVTTWYHVADCPPEELTDGAGTLVVDGKRYLGGKLDPSRPIVNTVAISNAAPSYATGGRVLVSTSALGVHDSTSAESEIRKHLASLYKVSTTSWQHVATYPIPYALPAMSVPHKIQTEPRLGDGLYLAGDYRDVSSINGAFHSGRTAAEAALADSL